MAESGGSGNTIVATNAFSKKVENHAAAVALYFMYYNFGGWCYCGRSISNKPTTHVSGR
jgi:hypothetical protein